jgi:hypothetical protein
MMLRAIVIAYERQGLSISVRVEGGGGSLPALYSARRETRFRALVFEVYNCLNFHVLNQVTFEIFVFFFVAKSRFQSRDLRNIKLLRKYPPKNPLP